MGLELSVESKILKPTKQCVEQNSTASLHALLLLSSSFALQNSPCRTFQKAVSLFFRLWFSWRLLLITAGAGSSWGCLCSAGSLWFANTFHLIQQWWWCAGMMWQQLFICSVGFSPPRLPRALKSGHREGEIFTFPLNLPASSEGILTTLLSFQQAFLSSLSHW